MPMKCSPTLKKDNCMMSMEKKVSRQEDHPEEEALTSSICSIEKVQAVQRKEKLDSFPLKLH